MFLDGVVIALLAAKREQEIVKHMRSRMMPAEFAEWQKERRTERRHRELCRSIEKAGDNARFRLFY